MSTSKHDEAHNDAATEHPKADFIEDIGAVEGSTKDLLEKNIKWSQVIYHQNKRMSRKLTLMVISNYFRLAIILIPIVLGIIYLPPIVRDVWAKYGAFIENVGGPAGPLQGISNLRDITRVINANTDGDITISAQDLQNIIGQFGR